MRPLVTLGRFFRHFISKYIPKIPQTPDFSETREKITPPTREIKSLPKAKDSTIKPEFSPSSSAKERYGMEVKNSGVYCTAHSHRFETGEELKVLEDALEGCNKAVVP